MTYNLLCSHPGKAPYFIVKSNPDEPGKIEVVETLNHEGNAVLLLRALSEPAAADLAVSSEGESKSAPGPIEQMLATATSHQRELFRVMRQHASTDGMFSMRYRDLAERSGVPLGSINYTVEGLRKRGLAMVSRPGGGGEPPVLQVANGHLLNQGA